MSKGISHKHVASGLPADVVASLEAAGIREPAILTAISAVCEHVVGMISSRVIQEVCPGANEDFLDQSSSPLGPRRHISAIRSGALPGKRVGRRYIALTSDVEKFLSESGAHATNRRPRDQESLAKELGVSDLL